MGLSSDRPWVDSHYATEARRYTQSMKEPINLCVINDQSKCGTTKIRKLSQTVTYHNYRCKLITNSPLFGCITLTAQT